MNRFSLRRLLGLHQELTIDEIVSSNQINIICPAETLSYRLPINIKLRSELPSQRMKFGFSFQDVPGLQVSECRLIELENCKVEMLLDEWDSVFIDVLYNGRKRIKFRGSGLPSNLTKNVQRESIGSWEKAALPLEIWSGNYGHWIAYHLPKLLSFIENGWRDQIILPERGRWRNIEERDATFLSLIEPSVKGYLTLKRGITEVKKLAIIDGDPHHAESLRKVASRLIDHASQLPAIGRQRLFISRSNAGWRKLINEHLLATQLRDLGFETLVLEDLPIARQIGAFYNAECIVATHGSGLANMIFCSSDAKIIEVVANDFPCPDFYRLATTMGLDYFLVKGESVGDAEPGYRDMVAPIDTITALVKELLS